MCGIFGFTLKYKNPEVGLKKMGDAMIHRGPDGEGYYTDSSISMGMRRLSIIDLETGDQPFYNHDKSVVAFCNGEIYNFQELREDLVQKGYQFISKSDVEVIPHLYEEYGIAFLEKLNGMFAISLYDKNKDKLFLVRDRLGIKPLYYSIVNGAIIYSSEIKPILSLNKVKKDVDFNALSIYMDLMYIPTPLSPFEHIKKLDSGSYLEWGNSEFNILKYWNLSLSDSKKDENECVGLLDDLLKDSVKKQLISDVPLGSFLSGGVDSSYVTDTAARLSKDEFSVFHMRWKDIEGKIDESVYAHQVADQHKVKKTFKDANKLDLIDLIPRLIYYLEEPFADAAFIPTYFLAKLASCEVKVILSGAGGDELFGGYSRYKNYSAVKSMAGRVIYGRDKKKSYYDVCKCANRGYWKTFFPWYKADIFKKEFDKNWNQSKAQDKFNAMMLCDLEYYLRDDILFMTDKMTMATSLECRVPLLDHRLVEKAQTIPSDYKIRNGEQKYIFKKIAEKYVPVEVLYRKKEGFGFPIEKWINEHKDLYFDILMEKGYLVQNKFINLKSLRKIILKTELTRSESWFYWQIIVLEIWFQLFIVGKKHQDIFNPE